MGITSLDILNLAHSLKDVCEVNCKTPECLSQTLKILLQYNLIQANLEFGNQFECPFSPSCPEAPNLLLQKRSLPNKPDVLPEGSSAPKEEAVLEAPGGIRSERLAEEIQQFGETPLRSDGAFGHTHPAGR